MIQHPYSYVVLRYVPDQGAAEALNVGIVVYSDAARFLRHRIDSHYERLSNAFATFDGQTFRSSVANLQHAFRDAERSFEEQPLFSGDRSLADWLRVLMPDVGGSLSFTAPRHGLADDLHSEVGLLFDRMVESQKARSEEGPHRTDAQVWQTYERVLSPKVASALRPKSFTTESVKVDFDHAIKNGTWHVVQPITMDYRQPESIQRRASQWAGIAMGLEGVEELGTVFFLLGQPLAHRPAYDRAKALLDRVRVRHEIIEESDAVHLDRRLSELLDH